MAAIPTDDYAAQQRRLLSQKLTPQVGGQQAEPSVPPPPPAPAASGAGYDYGKAQASWYNQGPGANLDQWIAANPTFTQGITSSKGGEIMNLPGGQSFDAIRDIGGANAAQWGDQQHDYATGRALSPQESQAAEAAWAAQNGGGGGGSSSYSQSGSPGNSDFQTQIRAMLLQQMGAMGKAPSEDDPEIKGEFDAQSRLIDRGRQDRRAAAAERMAAQGLNTGGQGSGAFDQETAAGYEDAGAKKSDVKSQLMGRELQSRRDKLTQMLSMAMQSGDSEAARSLQMQMAQMDDQIKRLGLAQSQSNFNDQYGLAAGQFDYQRDKDAYLYGAG